MHKHASLIHAWADGAEIEYYSVLANEWRAIQNPIWDLKMQYRIKQPQWQVDIITAIKKNKTVEVLVAKDTWVQAEVLKNLVKTDNLDLYSWQDSKDYRIKQETLYMWAYLLNNEWHLASKLLTESQARNQLRKIPGVEKIRKIQAFPYP